ncbi:carboxymuconolactone decarboxylase family protein [Actinomadura syzygii]|nr:carboxymuconolactone decarboxylase family protein [Actinomadura syzygii]
MAPDQVDCVVATSRRPDRLEDLRAAHGEPFRRMAMVRTDLARTHLLELVRIRTSQINDCAFCLRMHTRDGPLP